MKNRDVHEHDGTDDEQWNDFLTQKTGPVMEEFSTRYQITKRETEILLLIAIFGFSNREIAEQCVISEKTVKNHLANIMNKIGIQSMRQLLSLLIRYVLYPHEIHSETTELEIRT